MGFLIKIQPLFPGMQKEIQQALGPKDLGLQHYR